MDNITPYPILQPFGSFANMRRGKAGAIVPVAACISYKVKSNKSWVF
jgi:hypothetical protein